MPDEMNEPIASDLRLSTAHRLLPTAGAGEDYWGMSIGCAVDGGQWAVGDGCEK